MEYLEIRNVIQMEYEKQKEDTNFNFISRFAKAVYEAQKQAKNLSLSDVMPSFICDHCDRGHDIGKEVSICISCYEKFLANK